MQTERLHTPRPRLRGPAATVVLIALVALASFWPASAQEPPPYHVYLPLVSYDDPNILVSEGFEAGAVPPAGWTLISTDPIFTWKIWPFTPPYPPPTYPPAHDGAFAAGCDTAGDPQDEVLLSPAFQSPTAHLQFYSFGTTLWWINYHVYVWLVVGEWDNGVPVDDILVHDAADDWPQDQDYVWSPGSVDLTPYLPAGTPVRLAFEYKAGQNGDLAGLDSILVTRQ